MGNLISTSSYNSKGSTSARINDSSTSFPQPGQHISIRTFRELKARQMSRHMWRRTETPSNGGSFRSMEDQLEEVSSLPMMLTPKQLTQAASQMLLESLGN
nr:AC4 protein [Papaya leaf crumple virus]